jgi:crotonobetainyl-CoA:carnitine CoA-transferase CaiB-like acyl-CoA transferase
MTAPLDGLLVVELSRALAGLRATMMLADLGARVIKIEAPPVEEDTRGRGPPRRARHSREPAGFHRKDKPAARSDQVQRLRHNAENKCV